MRIRDIRSQTDYPGGTWQRRPRRIRHAPPRALAVRDVLGLERLAAVLVVLVYVRVCEGYSDRPVEVQADDC